MKKKLVLALCLAATLTACETPLRSASAREYQCGRHFVETSGAMQVIGGIFYNRTRENYKEGDPEIEEYVVHAWKSESMRDAHISGEFCIARKALCTIGAKHASNTDRRTNETVS